MQNNLHTDGPIDKKDAAGNKTTPSSSPHFTFESAKFYASIIAPGELGVVAAESSGMKTMFLCNLACILAANDIRVGFISVQMQEKHIWRRLYCMITDFPIEQLDKPEGVEQLNGLLSTCQHIHNIKLREADDIPIITRIVEAMTEAGVRVVIIDGFDSIEHYQASLIELNKLIAGLPALAKRLNISLWISSQVTSSADAAEIICQSELSATRAKAQEAAIVITLGASLTFAERRAKAHVS